MSFLQRVATLATMALGTALIGVSSPGLASQLDQTLNVPLSAQVPENSALAAVPAEAMPAPMAQPAVVQTEDEEEFDSLSEAVAAQSAPDALNDELTCLAGAIYFESKGEPLPGQLAVAEVIINRAKSGRFAKSVCAVVTQAGQFSFVRGGRIPAIASNANYRTAIAVAQVALRDQWDSPAPKALYFHARRVSPGWRMTKVASIGNHVFYR
ncbi:cell wall hydrolase [Sphingomonas hylomeconis]|uniref:Cell wall hydrolase n=1 Tax=Sphingomonas hylomeconis TaxID=1395958 RepID=A0ABV7SPK1_9SPHN|nr:cell wall hydrolase [Sphingomonas hylomeconis]